MMERLQDSPGVQSRGSGGNEWSSAFLSHTCFVFLRLQGSYLARGLVADILGIEMVPQVTCHSPTLLFTGFISCSMECSLVCVKTERGPVTVSLCHLSAIMRCSDPKHTIVFADIACFYCRSLFHYNHSLGKTWALAALYRVLAPA